MADVLVLHAGDDVGVALGDLAAGDEVTVRSGPGAGAAHRMVARDSVPAGHKVALHDLAPGARVRKYGEVIGAAAGPVAAGGHVHVHNLEFRPGELDHEPGARKRPVAPAAGPATFAGIVRPGGRVGTRNYLGVLTSVNCSATVAKLIARRAEALVAGSPHVDGVVALTHGTGCGMAAPGQGLDILRRTLRGYAAHPNFAGIVAVGLGCEVNQLAGLGLAGGPVPVHAMTIQEAGGTAAAVQAGLEAVGKLLPEAEAARRTPVPVSELVVALECGGSDAFSGITANPALGAAADLIVAHGGTAVLAETPEIYGAEHLLTARAAAPEVAAALLARIAWWQSYTAASGSTVDANPSPGNKAGGITTILEKSLGAIAKGGTTPLQAVYEYAEPVTAKGLVFMDTPGYDPVSVTGMVAGGAQVVCFTTGRGSVFGAKPAPSVKLCSNSRTYAAMAGDMDLNCGVIADGGAGVPEAGRQIFGLVLEVASGRRTASEALGFGDEEFTPWQLGAVL